ncbi:hypothetical protein OB955_15355 [Halobacteria archaeon AArc-m2/3/4]|uniref:Uncharacterized protein n=1 Tax=Natronoglomus mannanivorans TaxID=2979990 RepID=A0AAP3E2P8_9EURY|nr:hypothetical protein [Halobacteria archaeon AArc-xg1-1]MCU4974106.1 hypothetical protein [Halobacteria archaeon AArc-m2/3/4]
MRGERTDEADGTDLGAQLWNVPTILRFTAFVLLLVGFAGIVETGADPFAGDSVYSLAFIAGIVCAVVSIYLAIYRHDGGE